MPSATEQDVLDVVPPNGTAGDIEEPWNIVITSDKYPSINITSISIITFDN
jgi:hypothetical protein